MTVSFDPPVGTEIRYALTATNEAQKNRRPNTTIIPIVATRKVDGKTELKMLTVNWTDDEGRSRRQEPYRFLWDRNGLSDQIVRLDNFVSPNYLDVFMCLPNMKLSVGQSCSYTAKCEFITFTSTCKLVRVQKVQSSNYAFLKQTTKATVPKDAPAEPYEYQSQMWYDIDKKFVAKCAVKVKGSEGQQLTIVIVSDRWGK